MKLVRTPTADDLQDEIKKRFAKYNGTRPPSRGRRYPSELKELVCHGGSQGLKVATLCRLTGLSSTAVHRWIKAVPAPPTTARRLAVTHANPPAAVASPVVVRLPSGVTIELGDSRVLNGDLLATLSTLEVRHAASS